MTKLFGYELRRLLLNKFFLGLLAITLLYGRQVMGGEVVRGIANTAPFSGWSYGYYLSSLLPILLITLLFFITFLYSPAQRRVQSITDATPVDRLRYGLLRCGATAAGFAVISTAAVGMGLAFYARVFHYTQFGPFLLPTLFVLLPALVFTLGVGLAAGRIHPGLLYALMLLVLVLGRLELPWAADLQGNTFFAAYPATLPLGPDGEPEFVIPAAAWLGKALYTAAGAALAGLSFLNLRREEKVVEKDA